MKIIQLLIVLVAFSACTQSPQNSHSEMTTGKYAIAIHGGAGNLVKMNLTEQQQQEYRQALDSALTAGEAILTSGGTAIDAVEAAVKILEDCPLFNAGKGAVFTHEGTHELDAAIMDGSNGECGAVAAVQHIKNPIAAARKVMEKSEFILLHGNGAEQFAQAQGIELADSSYFFTPHRWEQLQEALEEDRIELDHSGKRTAGRRDPSEEKYGTVGCVALDKQGNLAAATSTGGLTNKRYGRIGDSPLIGSGTYADNATCAVSCTGKGEDFIRLNVAHDIASMMRYAKTDLQAACDSVVMKKLKNIKGRGGCIAIDHSGNIAMPFTTTGMFRASIDTAGKKTILIYEAP